MALSPFDVPDLAKPLNVTMFEGQQPVNLLTHAYVSRLAKSFRSFIAESNKAFADQAKEIKRLKEELAAMANFTVC